MVKPIYVPPLRAGALSRLVAGTRTFSPLCDATAFKAVVVHSEAQMFEALIGERALSGLDEVQ